MSHRFGPMEIEAWVRKHITELGREWFPDNPDVEWLVHGIVHGPELVLAEVEPRPDEVGYPRFKFGFLSKDGGVPRLVAVYCVEAGGYSLLAKDPAAPRGLPRKLL